MKLYLVRFNCLSPYLTPWRSCTVWGRMSWIVKTGAVDGWTIDRWIEAHKDGAPPLVVGDGFPYGEVPVPAAFLAQGKGKDVPKILPWKRWRKLCESGELPLEEPESEEERNRALVFDIERLHARIDRTSGTTLKEDGLFTQNGRLPVGGIVLPALVDDSLGLEGFRAMIEKLCVEGWGYGRNYGYGHIELSSIKDEVRPPTTGFVTTLGHCHPTDDKPTENSYWRWTGVPVRIHDRNTRRAPTERFTTMLLPGATFHTDSVTVGRALWSGEFGMKDYCHQGTVPTWPVRV